jgi:hypothetical protein
VYAPGWVCLLLKCMVTCRLYTRLNEILQTHKVYLFHDLKRYHPVSFGIVCDPDDKDQLWITYDGAQISTHDICDISVDKRDVVVSCKNDVRLVITNLPTNRQYLLTLIADVIVIV